MVKINDKRKVPEGVYFEDLEGGTVFIFDNDLFMKLDYENFEAVLLENGSIWPFGGKEKVRPVDIEINIIK